MIATALRMISFDAVFGLIDSIRWEETRSFPSSHTMKQSLMTIICAIV
jgi:hypothetical protein